MRIFHVYGILGFGEWRRRRRRADKIEGEALVAEAAIFIWYAARDSRIYIYICTHRLLAPRFYNTIYTK